MILMMYRWHLKDHTWLLMMADSVDDVRGGDDADQVSQLHWLMIIEKKFSEVKEKETTFVK